MDIKSIEITKKEINNLSPLTLAFIGDAVHTLYVRQNVIFQDINKMAFYHKNSAHFCKASCQSKVLDSIYELLTDEEKDLVRRTRNTKTNNIAKNSNLTEYKKATCFEALIGWLYLNNENERLDMFLKQSLIKGN